ncbi:MAG: hypothetical protein ACRD0K_13675 [Egibacteraceae bacterium]
MNVTETAVAGLGVEELDELTTPVIVTFLQTVLGAVVALVAGLFV